MNEISVAPLNLQRLVTREEIEKMRRLYRELRSVHKVGKILRRSPATVRFYLQHDPEEGGMRIKEKRDQREICRNCKHLCVLGTGSQILLICKNTEEKRRL